MKGFLFFTLLKRVGIWRFSSSLSKSRIRRPRLSGIEILETRTLLSVGQLDATFGLQGLVTTDFTNSPADGSVDGLRALAVDSQGRIIAVGGGEGQIARYLATGELDPNFGSNGRLFSHDLGAINDLAVLADDSLLLVGQLFPVDANGNSQGDFGIVKLTSTGTLDTRFGTQGVATVDVKQSGLDDTAYAITVLPDESAFYVGGAAGSNFGLTSDFGVVKFKQDTAHPGAYLLDTTFNGTGVQTVSFGATAVSTVRDIVIDPSNAANRSTDIVLVGSSKAFDTDGLDFALARMTSSGAAVNSFQDEFGNQGKIILSPVIGDRNDEAFSGVWLSDGTVVAGGYSAIRNGNGDGDDVGSDFVLAAVKTDGSLLSSFGDNNSGVKSVDFTTAGNPSGSEDRIGQLALQSNGRIVAAGVGIAVFGTVTQQRTVLARFDSNGALDTSLSGGTGKLFGSFFDVQTDPAAAIVIPQGTPGNPLDSWYVGGIGSNTEDFGLTRILASGLKDTANFGVNGDATTDFTDLSDAGAIDQVHALALGSLSPNDDFIIAVGGQAGQIARYHANDGSLDTRFNLTGKVMLSQLASVNDVAILPDNSLLVVGQIFTEDGNGDFGIVKVLPTGLVDQNFGELGVLTVDLENQGYDDEAFAISLVSDGFLVSGFAGNGNFGDSGSLGEFGVVKFKTDPVHEYKVDTTFGGAGIRLVKFGTTTSEARDMLVDPATGNIILVGFAQHKSRTDMDFAVARLTSTGALDNQFGGSAGTGQVLTDFPGHKDDEAFSAVLAANGVLYVGGYATVPKTGQPDNQDFAIAAYDANGNLLPTPSAETQGFGTNGLQTLEFAPGAVESDDQIGQLAIQKNVSTADSNDRQYDQIVAVGTAADIGPLGYRQRMALARFYQNGAVDLIPSPTTGGRIYENFNLSQRDSAEAIVISSNGNWMVGGAVGDGGNFGLVRFQPDDNHAPTDIQLSNAIIAENNVTNATIGALSAVDSDAGNRIILSLVGGVGSTDNAKFSIASNNTLTVGPVTNFETQANYSIRVRATDQGGKSFEKQFTINVTDLNEFNPTVSGGPFSVAENSANGTVVGTVTAADQDGTHGAFGFSITGGNSLGIFAISSVTGAITVVNNANLNFEAVTTVTLAVQISDNGPGAGRTGTSNVVINITDVNENPTVNVLGESRPNAATDGRAIYQEISLGGAADSDDIKVYFPGATDTQLQNAVSNLSLLYQSGLLNIWNEARPNAATDGRSIYQMISLGGFVDASDVKGYFPGATDQQADDAVTKLKAIYPTNSQKVSASIGSIERVAQPATMANGPGTTRNFSSPASSLFTVSGTQSVGLTSTDLTVAPGSVSSFDVTYLALDIENTPVNANALSFYILFDPTQVTLTAPVIPDTDPLFEEVVSQPKLRHASDLGVTDTSNPNNTELIFVNYGLGLIPGSARTLFPISFTTNANFTGSTTIAVLPNPNAQDPNFAPFAPPSLTISSGLTAVTAVISSVTSSLTNVSPIPVTVTFSGSVTDFNASNLLVSGATVSNFAGSGTDYTFDLTPTRQGTITVDLSSTIGSAPQLSRVFDNEGPAFTSSASVNVVENTTAVELVIATDLHPTVTYSLSGGADASNFTLNSTTGQLSFINAPEFARPSDADGNNVYLLSVMASDRSGNVNTQNISVTVTPAIATPVVTLITTPLTYLLNKKHVPSSIDPVATFNAGLPNPNLLGAKMIVSISDNRHSTDVLGIVAGKSNGISLKGKKLLLGKTVIGNVIGGKGKSPDLTIAFTNSATSSLVQEILRKVTYSTKSIGAGSRTIQIRLTNIGGENSNTATRVIDVGTS